MTPEFRAINEMGEVPVLEHQEKRLSQSRVTLDYLAGELGRFNAEYEDERREIADLSMCGYLYFTDELGVDLNDYPSVVRWLQDIKALEGWVHPYELMPGHPLK